MSLWALAPLPCDPLEEAPTLRPFPAEHWAKSEGRAKAAFGTGRLILSIAQARRRGLVAWHPVYRVYARAYESPAQEDRALLFYERRQAARQGTARQSEGPAREASGAP